ncbi:hypothetical protein K438DRAFT_1993265 [Mycena galopus ATCC 62051]|nr:hypothetical protein K438DRAFT_1993265 [Mycena galopus ATCC 62051]
MPSDKFSALSIELQRTIFKFVLAGNPAFRRVLRRVCRGWAIVLDRPTCNRLIEFTCIYWNGCTDDVLALKSMARGCRHMVNQFDSLRFDVRIAVFLSPFWDHRHSFTRALVSELKHLCPVVAPRARSLHVRGDTRILPLLFNCSWPKLAKLTLQTEEDPSDIFQQHCLQLTNAPMVASVSTAYITPSVVSFLPTQLITSLEIHTKPGMAEAPLDFFLHLVTAFPHLERLAVALDDISEPADTIFRVPFLNSLVLTSTSPPTESGWHSNWRNSSLWSHFVAPNLDDLTVPQRWFTMGAFEDLDLFFKRNGRVPRLIRFAQSFIPVGLSIETFRDLSLLALALVFVVCLPPSVLHAMHVHCFDCAYLRYSIAPTAASWELLHSAKGIDALPIELFVRIFDIVNSANPFERKVLQLVCKKWADIVGLFAACARHVDFFCIIWAGDDDMDALYLAARKCRLAMAKARTALIDLRVTVHVGANNWVPASFLVQEILREIAAVCSQAAHRTRSLEIVGTPHIVGPIFRVLWPRVRDIALHVSEDPSHMVHPAMFNEIPVTRFSCPFASPAIFAAFPKANLLTSLELFSSEGAGPNEASLDVFLLVLSSFPSLTRLRTALDDVVKPPAPDAVPFRHSSLRELYFTSSHALTEYGWNPEWVVCSVWSYFEAPALVELVVPQRWFVMGAHAELGAFFTHNSKLPRLVQFIGCPSHLMQDWEQRHASAWKETIVQVRGIVLSSAW